MDLLHLVDRLEELVANSQKMPIGSRSIIDRRRLLDIVDQMRVVIPQEVREAQEMVSHREQLEREAEEEARMIVARAEEQASRLVEEHEITQAARSHAEHLATVAEARLVERVAEANEEIQRRMDESRRLTQEQMSEADEYAIELLRRLERQLEAFAGSVRAGLGQLETEAVATRSEDGATPLESDPPAPDHASMDASEAAEEPPPVPVAVGAKAPAEEPLMEPIPLRGDASGGHATVEETAEELENLLGRPREPDPVPAEHAAARPRDLEAGVIDDFAQPRLDDERAHLDVGEDKRPRN